MLLIITSSVYVNSTFTKLVDPKEREKQYVDSFLFYINKSNFDDIIICDGSNFDFSVYNLIETGKLFNKRVEILFFEADKKKILIKGKGF
jgi:hypothetical protein